MLSKYRLFRYPLVRQLWACLENLRAVLIRLFLRLGSANGMSINLLGLEEGFDIPLAVLNVVKGELLLYMT